MKRTGILILTLLLILGSVLVFTACGNVDEGTINDAVTIANVKTEIEQAFEGLSFASDLTVNSKQGVISFSVENAINEVDLSALKITSGTLTVNGEAPAALTLAEGENTFTVSATSGTITVNYTLKITRKAASTDTCTHANTGVLYELGQEEEVTDQATLYAFTYCLACEELLGTDTNLITLASATVPYDGTAHSLTVSAEKDFPDGFSVTYSGNGQTAAGEHEITAHFYFDEEGNEIFLTATLTIVKDGTYHEVIFAAEDGNLSFAIPHGESIAEGLIPAIPGVTGYTRAWDYDGGAIEADETFTIIDTPITYTITYVLGDLTNSPKNPDSYTIESNRISLYSALPAAEIGEEFEGWYTAEDFDPDTRITAIPKGSTGDIVLYANVIAYRVEAANGFAFDYENYEYPALTQTVSVTRTSMRLSTTITVSEGCTWILSRDIEGSQTIATKNISLAIGHNLYYVTVWFDEYRNMVYVLDVYRLGYRDYAFVDWGSTVEEDTVEKSTPISAPETDPAHEGYTFIGWSVGGEIVSFPYALNENTTFTAEFTPNEYVLTYDVAEGDPLEESEVTATFDATFTPAIPTRTGYTFDGWANKYETVREPFTWQYAEDMTFVALWTPIDYAITYDFADATSVSKASNNSANPATYTIEDEVTFLAPSRVGYTFTGWDVESVEVGTYGEMTVTASWTAVNYPITYNLSVAEDSASKVVVNNNPATYTVEDEVTFASPTRAGYTFNNWDAPSIPAGSTGAKTVTASWSIVTYSITYNLDSGTNAASNPASCTVESAAILFSDPTRATYTFDGWYMEDSFTNSITGVAAGSTGAVKAYAKWVYYTVTTGTNLSGAGSYTSYSATKVTANTSVTLTASTNVGYTWLGWYDGESKVSDGTSLTYTFEMPAENKTYTAKWEVKPEMGDYEFTSTASTCTITSVKDKNIKSATIPSYVTSIGDRAFYYCTGLTSITVEAGNAKYHSAGNCLIETESKTLIAGCNNSVIPDDGSVTSIGNSAFYGCSGLTSVTIPSGVTSIGGSAFDGCSGLTSVTIPSSVTSIGSYAFEYCYKLVEVYNKSTLSISKGNSSYGYVGYYAKNVYKTEGGSKLSTTEDGYILYTDGAKVSLIGYTGSATELTLPTSITEIYQYAFYYCSGLTSITIPDGVTSIGRYAFEGCSGLTSIYYTGGLTGWCGISGLYNLMGYGATSKSLYIGGVNVVGDFVIPDGVTSIAPYAFYNCRALTSVTIPSSVTSIGSSAFEDCSGLTSITIPSSVTSIGQYAFSYCTGLTAIYYTGDLAGWCAISGLNYLMSDSYSASTKSLYINGVKVEGDLVIPDSVTAISDSAFYGCSGLTSVTIPSSVKSIGAYAFSRCSGLTSIYYTGALTGWCGISGLYNLMGYGATSKLLYIGGVNVVGDFVIPDGVTSIAPYAFSGCRGLTSVTIPSSVTSIRYEAFYYCTGLTSITFEGTKAQWNAIFKDSDWNYKTGNYTIRCTDGDISK